MLTTLKEQPLTNIEQHLDTINPDIAAMIRLMLGQPYQRPNVETLINFIEESIMWELAHRRTNFDKIDLTKIDNDQYAIVQNFIAHRDEPFGLPMPSGRDLFPPIG